MRRQQPAVLRALRLQSNAAACQLPLQQHGVLRALLPLL
jgi:hypothetical protein